ncbi:MAG: nucleotide exchange factor GrpE [Pontibacterium sp.]
MANEENIQSENENVEPAAESVDAPETDAAQEAEVAENTSVDLAGELAAAQATIAELKDQALRSQAEAQNVRRRAEQDVEKAHKFALEKFALEMIEIADNLERAVQAAGEDEATQSLREGVEMTLSMFVAGLAKFNVEQVDPTGEAFNPDLHQAMSMVPAGDAAPNSVVAVMQKGYTLSGRLLRPAMVMVAQG